ncbi:MAG: methylated-DNA--[protein]-cysteine S-methyltransferase [Anaerolineae bacterium]
MDDFSYTPIESHIGTVWVASTHKGVCKVSLGARGEEAFRSWLSDRASAARPRGEPESLMRAVSQLREYLSGRRQVFELPLDVRGTAFQRAVWNRVGHIPYGETTTYGAIAYLIGNPNASRAVGAAVGANPVPIIVPCHRVIGASGALTGFGGGLEVKESLLRLEGAYPL